MSSLLTEFIDFPNNFWEWIKECSFNGCSFYSFDEAKLLYKKNSRNQVGFMYRKYRTKNISIDIASYHPYDIIPEIGVDLVSVGKPDVFFGSFLDYKTLIFNMMDKNKFGTLQYDKYFFDFGKTYLFGYNQIKGPLEILKEII